VEENFGYLSKGGAGAPWKKLLIPDFNWDIRLAKAWLVTELDKLPDATGIYLGLDTLNMKNGKGMNVGIGGTADCDPTEDSSDWLESKLTYGNDHLVRGLLEFKQEYSKPSWRVKNQAVVLEHFNKNYSRTR
jgi:hypothetical protein